MTALSLRNTLLFLHTTNSTWTHAVIPTTSPISQGAAVLVLVLVLVLVGEAVVDDDDAVVRVADKAVVLLSRCAAAVVVRVGAAAGVEDSAADLLVSRH